MSVSEALIESKTLRDAHIDNVAVLEKVKSLALLPDDIHVTTQMVSDYYEVPVATIESAIEDNRNELESDGFKVLMGEELALFKSACQISSKAKALAVFPRRSVLRMGMLLRDSNVAKQIRNYLLNVEMVARQEQPQVIVKALKKPTWNQIQSNVRAKSKMFKMLGLPEDSALAHALNHEELEAGVDLTPFKRLVRDEDTDQAVTPTELGKTFDPVINAQKMNLLLEKCGLQIKNVKKDWELTAKGKPYAKLITTVINKKENDKIVSSEKQAIRWKLSVLEVINTLFEGEQEKWKLN